MYDARNLTMAQLRDLAGIKTNDGWMATGQLRQVTSLPHAAIYAITRRLRVTMRNGECGKEYWMKDVLNLINISAIPLAPRNSMKAPAPRVAIKRAKLIALRLTDEEVAALLFLCKRVKMTQSSVIRHLILTAHKNLA